MEPYVTFEDCSAPFNYASAPEQSRRLVEMASTALACWDGSFDPPTMVKYRENAVCATRDPNGVQYALRIHRAGYHSNNALSSELLWLSQLGAAGVHVPRVIPDRNGQLYIQHDHKGVPDTRQIDLLSWIEGRPLRELLEGNSSFILTAYEKVGRAAGLIHSQSTAWSRPAFFVRQAWNEDGILGPDPLWGRFWELPELSSAQRDLLLKARDIARDRLIAYGKSANNYGLIHADLLPDNVIVQQDDVGIIDFDDSGFGWFVFEIATALYTLQDHTHYEGIKDAVVIGYRSIRPLSDHDLAQLPLFFLLRALTYLGWAHTRRETSTAKAMLAQSIISACSRAEALVAG